MVTILFVLVESTMGMFRKHLFRLAGHPFLLSRSCLSFDIYLLTYLLNPWSRVLLEKVTGSAASQEIPRIFGTRRFLTVLTSARHLSLS
jgi:hypothetical protein